MSSENTVFKYKWTLLPRCHLKDLAYNPQRISLVFALTLAPTRLNHKKYGLCIIQEHNICIIWKGIHTSLQFWKMSFKNHKNLQEKPDRAAMFWRECSLPDKNVCCSAMVGFYCRGIPQKVLSKLTIIFITILLCWTLLDF